MTSPFSCLRCGRETKEGLPLPQKTSKGVLWAVISAVVIIAASIFTLIAIGNLALAGVSFYMGAFLPGLMQIASSIMIGLAVASMGMIAAECVKNAHHHLRRRATVFS